MQSKIPFISQVKVSSVLNKDNKQYGKQFLFDGNEETCWNSHQGSPQSIQVEFSEPCSIQELHIKFQGGFVGKNCQLFVKTKDNSFEFSNDFYPADDNSLQKFSIEKHSSDIIAIRIVFQDSTDFYGRITIYSLDILG